MENAQKIIHRWCKTKGPAVNPLKTNTMILTRKYKPEPAEPLRLQTKEITFTGSVKHLEIISDPKLTWNQHLWMYKAILSPKLL
jgi:hypothetical protein